MASQNLVVPHTSLYDEITSNKRKSILLFLMILAMAGVLFLLITYIYSVIFRVAFFPLFIFMLPLIIIVSVLQFAISYYSGEKIILKAVGAYPPDERKHIFLLNTVEGVSIAAGIPKPKVFIIPHKDINAFATGRDPEHAVIAVTEGALEKLNRKELEGVIAHEIAHIRNYDIRFTMLVAVAVGLVAILAFSLRRMLHYSPRGRSSGYAPLLIFTGIILSIIAPLAVRLVQLSISRQREYLADFSGVELVRDNTGLIGALKKLQDNKHNMEVSEAVSHLFFDDPVNTFVDNIWETHPPIEERIRRLMALG